VKMARIRKVYHCMITIPRCLWGLNSAGDLDVFSSCIAESDRGAPRLPPARA